jgi:hypothetical protein
MVLVIVPAQHEIADQALRLSELDGDVQDVLRLGGTVLGQTHFQHLSGLFARAWGAVEIPVDGLVLEDQREIVEVTLHKRPQQEPLGENRLK